MGNRFVPANVPYLQNKIVFAPGPTIVTDIMKYKPKGYPKKRHEIEELLKKLPDMTIEFDFDQLDGSTENQDAPLEPGNAYFLTASVVFEPIYKQGIWGPLFHYPNIDGWNFRIEGASVQKTKLDWFSRQQAEVRYTIKIAHSTKQVIVAYETDMKTFLDSIGSSAGLVAAGVFILSLVHFLTCQVREQRKKKAEDEQDKVVKAVLAKVVKSLRRERRASSLSSGNNSPVSFSGADPPLKSGLQKMSIPLKPVSESKSKDRLEIPNLDDEHQGAPSPRGHHEDGETVSPLFRSSFRSARVAPSNTAEDRDADLDKNAELV